MSISSPERLVGSVASLHIHAAVSGEPLISVASVEAVEQMGLREDTRYFGRRAADGGPSARQVTLMEREQMAKHATALGVECFPPAAVRANLETFGLDLVSLIGQSLQVGEAVLYLVKPRDPCEKMDRVRPGLRALMANHRQGVVAQVVRSGRIRVGDGIVVETNPDA